MAERNLSIRLSVVDGGKVKVLKAEHAHQRLLLVVQGLKKLFADEHFVNLLRAGEC